MKIQNIHGRQILDSRGNPTVECELTTDQGTFLAAVPSGASTGSHEACELRDGGKEYLGKGVLRAVANINSSITHAIKGKSFESIQKFDEVLLNLDGSENKKNLGANAILAASMAATRGLAAKENLPLWQYLSNITGTKPTLPVPLMNIINGGEHANNSLDIQEFMIMPFGKTFGESLRWGAEIFHHLKKIVHGQKQPTTVGDEGGFAPNYENHEQALEAIAQAVKVAGLELGRDIFIALDVAATELFQNDQYMLGKKTPSQKRLSRDQWVSYLEGLSSKFPIISCEDGASEDDAETWAKFMSHRKIPQIVGDDLLVTNTKRLGWAKEKNLCNAVLVKLNQVGSVSETLATIAMANQWGWGVIISHRSGETEDSFIADLAVGTGAGQIKTGSLSRSDRLAKYNQLLRIEDKLGPEAIYAGAQIRGKLTP